MTDRPKGRVVDTELVRRELALHALALPLGTPVQHSNDRRGIVRADNPDHVPGIHLGRPTAWCLTDEDGADARVCVSWDNPDRLTWLAWVPVRDVQVVAASRTNLPALAVKGR